MQRVWSVLARLSPWILIVGLAYAAIFVKVAIESIPMTQPLLEQRDQFLGGMTDGERYWFVGRDSALLSMDVDTRQWQRTQLEPRNNNLQGIAASNAGVIVVVGNGGRLWVRGTDERWTTQVLPLNEVASKLIDVAFLRGHFWVVGEMGAVFRGAADGGAWTRMRDEEDLAFNRIRSGPDNSLWITAESGHLLRSHDDGLSWDVVELGDESLQSIDFVGDVGLVVGNRGHVYRSENAGVNWTAVPPFTDNHLYDVAGGPSGWIAVGDHGAAFSGDSSARQWRRVDAKKLSRNYFMRVLRAPAESVLIGHDIGQLVGSDDYQAWPIKVQP